MFGVRKREARVTKTWRSTRQYQPGTGGMRVCDKRVSAGDDEDGRLRLPGVLRFIAALIPDDDDLTVDGSPVEPLGDGGGG